MKKYLGSILTLALIATLMSNKLCAAIPSTEKTSKIVFDCRVPEFDFPNYYRAITVLFSAFENESGTRISPDKKGKVGLKIYTNSGAGMSTPTELVDAVIAQLEKRGYKRSDIAIVDMSRRKMRDCGFLPRVSQVQKGKPDDYKGCPVIDIDSGMYFDSSWFYDNALMPKTLKGLNASSNLYNPELRKSYLPVPLFLTVDFWINLPVITDMEGLGVCAALGNVSIWNMSNNERFLKQPANASMAAAEVCAIPELRASNLMTILSLERGQYVGGAIFNSRCSFSENTILLSSNPVAIDFIAWQTINRHRQTFGFDPINPLPPLLNYCRELKVGDFDFRKIKRVEVPFSSKGK